MVDELLTIDPGATLGWARFTGGLLAASGHCKMEAVQADFLSVRAEAAGQRLPPEALPAGTILLGEHPTYRGFGGENRGSPGALISLGVTLGELVGLYRRKVRVVEFVTPNEWKGSVPKEICHARILKLLKPEELAVLDSNHNAMDSVGIGLWRVGRYVK